MAQNQSTHDSVNVTFGAGASKIFMSEKRFIVAISGQRGGKTSVASHWFVDQILKPRQEQTSRGVKTVGTTGIICAPTYDLLNTATLDRFFEEYPQYRKYYRQYQKTIKIPIGTQTVNGKKETIYSTIFTLSVDDPQNLRGKKCWVIWGDEVDIAPEDTWEMMTGRIADHQDGKLLITSTLAMDSWINRKVYQPLMAGRLTNTEIISWPSIDRPGFPREEWDRLKAEMDPIKFARDFEGKFAFESGLVYGDILKYGIIDQVPDHVKMLAVFYGLDYGLNDPTVILVMGYGSDGCWYVLQEHVKDTMDVEEINQELSTNLTMFNNQYGTPWATYYDPSGGVATLSLIPECFPIAAVKDIPARITLVRNFIHQRRVFILDHCTITKRECSLYSFADGKPLPKKGNDHCMDAMGYVIHNGWLNVDGLTADEAPKEHTRLFYYELERGIIDENGILQAIPDPYSII